MAEKLTLLDVKIMFTPKGAYDENTVYERLDFITSIDSTYLYINQTPSKGIDVLNTDYWMCLADGKPATLAAAYATAQADYAKDQGDILNNRLATFYGCEWQKGGLDAQPIRWIGDERYQTDHVIFNDFKVAKVKDGKVIGVLNQTNWFEMEDGTPSGIIIDGTDVTDDGCDIMLVNEKGFYVLNGGTDPNFERRIVSDAPFTFGSDRAIYIEPFGMTVDFAIVKGGVSRCIRDNTHSGTATTGNGGVSYLADGLGVPTTYISRFGAEGYARAKNVDTSLNAPYANTFQLDKNVWATLLFIKFQTKDLHNQDCVGPCISANDSAPNIWGDKTGIRVKNVDETYSHYNTNSSRFMSAVGGTSWNFYQLINNYRPLLKIFDCQLALSHAKQNNIPQNTLFEFDGFQYSYENIQGSKGIADGEMTAKVRKFVTVQFTGYDNVDKVDVVDKDVEYCFEQGVVHGKIAGWGNIWEWVSGLEGVIDGDSNSRYYFYQTDDVRKLTTDSDSTDKENGEVFAFQNSYDYLGSDTNTNGYVRQMFDNSLMGMTLGGSLHTAECGYRYSSTSADAGKLVRRGVYFGGNAHYSYCALRIADASNAPTATYANFGFGFRVTLP
ncbi:MAG: hypothetical protein PHN55_12225 [Dysgonamonadaceae bacterium]|nr:hypothetical protein [Dysgonamonadaceae bacterium]